MPECPTCRMWMFEANKFCSLDCYNKSKTEEKIECDSTKKIEGEKDETIKRQDSKF